MGKTIQYDSILDVYDEIIRLYEEAETKGFNVGESIYKQSAYFVDYDMLVNSEMQDRIKEFQFCKQFSCPPFPSLNETPPVIIDDYTIIEQELKYCIERKNNA